MRLTRVLVPSVRASPAAGKAAERLGFSPALRASFALRMKPMHLPPEQLSPVVVALPSVHVSALARCSQPVGGGELTSVVQRLASSQGGTLVLVVVEVLVLVVELLLDVDVEVEVVVVVEQPAMAACWQPLAGAQLSAVQGFPSSQLIGLWVQPLAGAQPSVVQMFASSQLIALPTHWPARQASAVVQALASLHGVPLATGACVQTPA